MITRTVILVILLFIPISLLALNSSNKHVSTCIENKCKITGAGPINFSKATSHYNAKNIFFEFNKSVNGELRLFHTPTKEHDYIRGEFVLDNRTNAKISIQYHVAFKDKKGLITQTKGELLLHSGKKQKIKFSNIPLTAQDMKNITSYEIRLGLP